jgi:hypothetical protein
MIFRVFAMKKGRHLDNRGSPYFHKNTIIRTENPRVRSSILRHRKCHKNKMKHGLNEMTSATKLTNDTSKNQRRSDPLLSFKEQPHLKRWGFLFVKI